MDEETCGMKVKEETTKVAAHLRRNGQLQEDKEFVYYRVCPKLPRIMPHELTFSGYRDLWDRPNRRRCREIVFDHEVRGCHLLR